MFFLKFVMAVWPLAALKVQREEPLFEFELKKLELWNHEEEIFQRAPNVYFENHMERAVKLGPSADYQRLII